MRGHTNHAQELTAFSLQSKQPEQLHGRNETKVFS